MANLDARSKLNITHGFHDMSNKIWDNETCSSFLPKLNYIDEESFEPEDTPSPSPSRRTSGGSQRSGSNTRASGPSSATIEREDTRYPWMCSLKETGFRGKHKCGVTLLSGKPNQTRYINESFYEDHKMAPTIFVGAAHCNFICKDFTEPNNPVPLETCCCLPTDISPSCKKGSEGESSYCPADPEDAKYVAAEPEDLQIVCRVHNVGPVPESVTKQEEEIVLTVTGFANHPEYQVGEKGSRRFRDGPYKGYDISVYHVDDRNLRLEEGKLWPACLPRLNLNDLDQAFFAGWKDQEPLYALDDDVKVSAITDNDYLPRRVQVRRMTCKDPDWMKSETFYPARTLCYRDPSQGSCFQHGNSGSSVMTFFNATDGNGSYSFTGPLSMHKGCDKITKQDNLTTYGSENPGVFTDARCFMDWIASQYRMRIPGWKPKECFDSYYPSPSSQNKARDWFSLTEQVVPGTGNESDIDKEECWGSFNYDHIDGYTPEYKNCSSFPKLISTPQCTSANCTPDCTEVDDFAANCKEGAILGCMNNKTIWASQKYDKCAFSRTWNECRLQGAEGFSYNIYQCKNKEGELGVCANNCKGVNPNSIIIGGFAPVAIVGLAAQGFLQPALIGAAGLGAGAIGVGAAVGGGRPNLGGRCPNTRPCRVRDRGNPRRRKCCRVLGTGQGRVRCPRSC